MVLRAFFYLHEVIMEDDLVLFGGELKALGGGKVGGVLVRMTSEADPDLTNDFFSVKSDVRFPETLDVYYNHGRDATLKKRVIGTAKLSRTETSDIWAETQLNLRDEYEQQIYAMAEAGKLGYSSGALSHLVEREPAGKAYHIKTWVIGEASLTPTPAEYRNTVQSIKSIQSLETLEKPEMTEPIVDVDALVEAKFAQREAAQKAAEMRAAETKAAKDLGYQEAVKELAAKQPKYHSTKAHDDDNEGVDAFKSWLSTGQQNGGLIQPDNAMKAAFNITTGASGGYLVPDPLYTMIIAKRDIASFVRSAPTQKFTTPADHILVPVEDTAHTDFVETAEGAAYDENEATVAQVDIVLKKYTKVVKASEEFLADNGTNFDSWLVEALARAEAGTENALATAVLYAAAGASGITTASATAITIPELAATVGSLGGGYNVAGQVGFLMKNATEWYLKGVFGTNYYAFDGLMGMPAYISDDMEAVASTKKAVLFGNFNFLGVAEKPGMLVQRNPYLYMASGQVGIFANIFRGFAVLQADAFKTLLQKT